MSVWLLLLYIFLLKVSNLPWSSLLLDLAILFATGAAILLLIFQKTIELDLVFSYKGAKLLKLYNIEKQSSRSEHNAMSVSTLSSGSKHVPYMPMTIQPIPCPPPILEDDFDDCRIPGGVELWESGGFYSPGECFLGYRPMCTQTSVINNGWPIREGETAVRCIPVGYDCNASTRDQKYATSNFDGTILSAPAFEIRWRSRDLESKTKNHPPTETRTIASILSNHLTPSTTASMPKSTTNNMIPSTSMSNPATSPSLDASSESNFVLNTGSIAGIIVGSCVGFVAIISTILFFLVRRRRERHGSRRLEEEHCSEQYGTDGELIRPDAQIPVELENKPMGPKELSADTHHQTSIGEHSRLPYVPVNSMPVEIAGDSAPAPSYSRNRLHG